MKKTKRNKSMDFRNGSGRCAVVFGATGLVGRELTMQLISGKQFDKVIAVTRRKSPTTYLKLEQIQIDDFSMLDAVKEQLRADCYFCCIGTTIKNAGSKDAFIKVDHDIPVKIAETAAELSVPSLVVISSIGANAGSSNFYLRTKGEMELSVSKIYPGRLKIVRPSLLMGDREEFRFGEKVSVVFMKLFGWIFSGPLKKFRGINAIDVANVMIKLSEDNSGNVIFESDEIHNLK